MKLNTSVFSNWHGLGGYTKLSRVANMMATGAVITVPVVALAMTAPVHAAPLSTEDKAFVDATVKEVMQKEKLSQYSISISGPKGDYTQVYGVSNKAKKTPATPEDHFRIGSITKSFTAIAVLQLVDQGKLSLDDTLDKFVTGVPNGHLITVKHMLMMRSGVFDYHQDTAIKLVMNLIPTWNFSPAGALQAIRKHPSQFTPGTKYQYTNSNYQLLGMVIEKVTGKPYQTVITENVIQPMGLTETGFPDPKKFQDPTMPSPVSHGYGSPVWGANYDMTKQNPALVGAAGAMWSTIGDLHKFADELKDLKMLSPAMQQMYKTTFCPVSTPNAAAPNPKAFGYGMGLISYGKWLGHDGSIPGYSTESFYEPNTGAVIAGYENKQTPSLTALTYVMAKIADRLYPGSMETQSYPEC